MKKVLTILLALLVVTGVVFADEPPAAFSPVEVTGSSTLTLKSTVSGDFQQGFTENLGPTMSLGNLTSSVDLKDTDAQAVGHYYVYTNSSVAFTVAFTVNPLVNGEMTSVKVPYTLGIVETATEDISYGDRFTLFEAKKIDLGLDSNKTWHDEITASPAITVITSTAGGSGVMALDLKATFAGNDDLPEGEYTGTVYANIVTDAGAGD